MVWGREKGQTSSRKKRGQEEMLVCEVFSSRSLLPLERVTLPECHYKIVWGGENWETNLFSLSVKQDYLSYFTRMLPLVSMWIRTGLEAQDASYNQMQLFGFEVVDFIKNSTSWLPLWCTKKPFSFPPKAGVCCWFVWGFLSWGWLILRKGWSAYV